MPYFAKVAIPIPIRKLFDYTIPAQIAHEIVIGSQVLVPFGAQKLCGIVIEITQQTSLSHKEIKSVTKILNAEAVIPKKIMDLCLWASEYYHFPIGEVLSCTIPAKLRNNLENELKPTPIKFLWQLSDLGKMLTFDDLQKAPKQQKAWQLLLEQPQGVTPQTLTSLGIPKSTLNSLFTKKIIEKQPQESKKTFYQITSHLKEDERYSILSEPELTLTEEQKVALATINENDSSYKTFVLQGITGSGKTEVYLQFIHHQLAQGKQALILIPEINLTPQTVARFKRRFLCDVECFHSKMAPNEKFIAWEKIKNGASRVLIGTRSAIFTPMPMLGAIIIDEEHDTSFKQQESFRYSARDLAIWRAKQENIPILLGSATPSLETWYNCLTGRFTRLILSTRPNGLSLPAFRLIDIRKKKLEEGLSQLLMDAIHHTLEEGEQVILFLNRRGFAPVLICHACGWQAKCDHCEARLVLHQFPPLLQCHFCQSHKKIFTHCPECKQPDLQPLGIGTQKIESYLQDCFPNFPVIRMDRDSTRLKNSLEEKLTLINHGKPCILVGTKMISKGHHFPKVTLVAIPDADHGLFSIDFRGTENLVQMITQVSGRAGRGDKPGTVIIQTCQPEHPLWQVLPKGDYDLCLKPILEERKCAHFPPFSYLGLIRAEAAKLENVTLFLSRCRAFVLAQNKGDELHMIGPSPAPLTRKAGAFQYQLLFIAAKRSALNLILKELIAHLEESKMQRCAKWSIDIDPIDLY